MNKTFKSFLTLQEKDRKDVFEQAAKHLYTEAEYIEKDFWVCLVLDALYNGLPEGHPKLLFKGGTSLSKVFGLVRRFSEDIDIVVYREDLGFEGERDPTIAANLSNKKRKKLFEELRAACSNYILTDLKTDFTRLVDEISDGCRVYPDPGDGDRQTLLVEYPSLYTESDFAYVAPQVKVEGGARSALDPNSVHNITPYIADELPDWSFDVENITANAPERTYLDKLLILHTAYTVATGTADVSPEKRDVFHAITTTWLWSPGRKPAVQPCPT